MEAEVSGCGRDDQFESIDWEAAWEEAAKLSKSDLPLTFRIIAVRRLAAIVDELLTIHCDGLFHIQSDPMDIAYIHAKTKLWGLLNSEGLEDLAKAFPAEHLPDSLYQMDFPDCEWEELIRPSWHAFRGAVNQEYVQIRDSHHTGNPYKWIPAEDISWLWNVTPEELGEKIKAGEIRGCQFSDGTWRIYPWEGVERFVRTQWLEGCDELLERARQAKDDVDRELLARRRERAAQLGFGVPGPDRSSSRQRGKKRGARRLEERGGATGKPSKPEELQSEVASGSEAAEQSAPNEPWLKIPSGRQRGAVRRLWRGEQDPEIGRALRVSPHTVSNWFSDLRKHYGRAIVPTRDDLRRKGLY